MLNGSCWFLFCFGLTGNLNGQEQHSLGNQSVEVIKPYQPVLNEGHKISEVPALDTARFVPPVFRYEVITPAFHSGFEVTPLKPVKQRELKSAKGKKYFLKGGLGNYWGSMLEGTATLFEKKDYFLMAGLSHQSFQGSFDNNAFPGNTLNRFYLFESKSFASARLENRLEVSREGLHYFGFNPSEVPLPSGRNQLSQRFSRLGMNSEFQSEKLGEKVNNFNAKIRYKLLDVKKPFALGLADGTIESHQVGFTGTGVFQFEHFQFLPVVYTDWDFTYKNTRGLIGLKPSINKAIRDFAVRAGLDVAMHQKVDIAGNPGTVFGVFPDVSGNWTVFERILFAYASVGGGFRKNTLSDLSMENRFLRPDAFMSFSKVPVSLKAGARGAFTRIIFWEAEGAFERVENMPFFINQGLDFNLEYDVVNHGNASVKFKYLGDGPWSAEARADYHYYALNSLSRPWHKPAFELSLKPTAHLGKMSILPFLASKNILLKGNFLYSGSRPAKGLDFTNSGTGIKTTENVVTLPGFFDAGIGFEYIHSNKLSFFLDLNNLGASPYKRWYAYRAMGFNVMGGASFYF